MHLNFWDWIIIFSFFAATLVIGFAVAKTSGKSKVEYFLGGRAMPWWLLGFSMVATTFSTDTPNLVTNFVRTDGIAGNWGWWAFLLTGMLTVFVYAKLWRRSNVVTDIEFYELRYSGKAAAFLRGFRALYLGVFFNVMIMGTVSLAAIKIGTIMLGISPFQSVFWALLVTVIFSSMGGFRGVLITDFVLFIVAMIGAFAAAYYALSQPQVGGLGGMITQLKASPDLAEKLDLLPSFSNTDLLISAFIIPLAVQWWSTWYPGSEPGGGGYLVQRMLAAKNEKHAVGATLFFNVAHYALRPWPWIIVALCSMLVFPIDSKKSMLQAEKKLNSPAMQQIIHNPESYSSLQRSQVKALTIQSKGLTSLSKAFPEDRLPLDKLGHDAAYSAMLNFLPNGWLGLVLASLIAAYMSTISTHLNWGSSYVVNDFYKRFVRRDATERQMVWIGRVSTVVLMVLTTFFALQLTSAVQAFNILLSIGAGTGLLFILRWFWWRINAFSEIAAMIVSFLCAVYFQLIHPKLFTLQFPQWMTFLLGVIITTIVWVAVTYLTRPTEKETLRKFCQLTNPGGPGWKRVIEDARSEGVEVEFAHKAQNLPLGILCMFLGCLGVYCTLFATGYFIYGRMLLASVLSVVAAATALLLIRFWKRINA
ncbi:Na+:solute symporter [Lentisphaerota bacterium ZTH]|nr:Na+:solute symporter [Lentisphaerota bacterium]WET07625.1 Na+:solute symporter [Lentisphaerota bacterium ZTH]